MQNHYHVIIVGASSSGLFCALEAAKRGKSVLILEHQNQAGRKILASGGGNCNFTNLELSQENYLSKNPSFCISALKRFSQFDCIDFFKKLGVNYYEKQMGQLFCVDGAKKLLNALFAECKKYQVNILFDCKINCVNKNDKFYFDTNFGSFESEAFVVATGGLSYKNLGASDFGYTIARQFGLQIIETKPALVPLKFNFPFFKELSGISLKASVKLNNISFCDDLLFTHFGLSGPAILQISSYWNEGDFLEINLLPDIHLFEYLNNCQLTRPKTMLSTLLSELLPKRLAKLICENWLENKNISQYSKITLEKITQQLQCWKIKPTKTLGYDVAEVTKGGVDTNELSSKTFEAKKVKGLYFIGEVIDITGQLGGYNLQWAWSSGYCCGQFV